MGKVERFTNCTTGGPMFVDVEDGKIVRMIPIDLDENDPEGWTIQARGRDVQAPAPYDAVAARGGAEVHGLLAQADPHSAQAGGLRSQGRAQHPESRRLRIRADQLGRGPRHRVRRDRPPAPRGRARPPS